MAKIIGATVGFGVTVDYIEGEDSNETAGRILAVANEMIPGEDPFIVQMDEEPEDVDDDDFDEEVPDGDSD